MIICSNTQAVVLITALLLMETGHSLWWSFGHKEPLLAHNRICKRVRKLKGAQRSLCRNDPEIMNEVIKGSASALRQCSFQFKDHRWNCTQNKKWMRKILKQDSKESAALNAFVAAGVMHSVTLGCSSGKLPQCSCKHEDISHSLQIPGKSPHRKLVTRKHKYSNVQQIQNRQKFEPKTLIIKQIGEEERGVPLNGCGDDVEFGYKISRKVMDYRYTKDKQQRDARTLLMLHNNEAGREIVKHNMQTVCKCHGLSGSCSFKTCSKKLPSIVKVGRLIYEKYLSAIKVIATNDGKGIAPYDSWRNLSRESLVYLEDSANFCRKNTEEGSPGTKGRECQASAGGFGSCDLLCCGRGHRTFIVQDVENCRCKFEFCCKVICEKCNITREKAYCN